MAERVTAAETMLRKRCRSPEQMAGEHGELTPKKVRSTRKFNRAVCCTAPYRTVPPNSTYALLAEDAASNPTEALF